MKRQGSLCFFIFKAITLALQKSRRERLKEELDSDFEHTFSKKLETELSVLTYIVLRKTLLGSNI
jgi:hypothetical protein